MRDIFEARPLDGPSRIVGGRRAPRAGFTLVEMLMVILIISMLVALLYPAISAAKAAAVRTSIKMDVNELVTALESFKAKYGAYPPDRNWTVAEIGTFLRRAFPRYNPQAGIDDTATKLKNLDEAESLVFWLGGVWDKNTGHMTGFSADPNPKPDLFAAGGQRTTPFLQFAETRLYDRDGKQIQGIFFPEYYPPNININQAPPYVYFAARPNQKYWNVDSGSPVLPQYTCSPNGVSMAGPTTAVPYHFKQPDNPNDLTQSFWVKPTGFQIICAGIDNEYGTVPGNPQNKVFPFGTNYSTTDNDNIVSFTERTLGDAQP